VDGVAQVAGMGGGMGGGMGVGAEDVHGEAADMAEPGLVSRLVWQLAAWQQSRRARQRLLPQPMPIPPMAACSGPSMTPGAGSPATPADALGQQQETLFPAAELISQSIPTAGRNQIIQPGTRFACVRLLRRILPGENGEVYENKLLNPNYAPQAGGYGISN